MSEVYPEFRVVVVLPAYNAARTLRQTFYDIPKRWIDEVILIDDASADGTASLARELGIDVIEHIKNVGYGGNQKTCYQEALDRDADIIIMVHPDHQYDPRLVPDMLLPIIRGDADAVFGSRMMIPKAALSGGMPLWKYIPNKWLTLIGNLFLGTNLTEFHSGFRAYNKMLLQKIPYNLNSDGFVFDTEIIIQLVAYGFRIVEVPISTRYFKEASQIGFFSSVKYGLQILFNLAIYRLHVMNIMQIRKYDVKYVTSSDLEVVT
jgi:glycosyltransferase involved in cell wall biosynthesis